MSAYLTVTQLKHYKSEEILIGLYSKEDPADTFIIDEDGVVEIIENQSGYIDEYLTGVYTVPATVPETIKKICLGLTLDALYNRGEGLAASTEDTRDIKLAKEMLDDIKNGDLLVVGSDSIGITQTHDTASFDQNTLKTGSGNV